MADAAILQGQLVQPVKALAFEYRFAYPTVDQALSQLLR
jgi:Predicted nucleoside-diphosphate sugar epimerase